MKIKVDSIYVLSLPGSSRRFPMIQELERCGISEYEMINSIPNEKGLVGLQETMSVVLWSAKNKNQERILILEDDCVCEVDRPIEFINKCIEQLPNDFDILQLGANLVIPPKKYSDNLLQVSYSHATHANIYSKKGYERVMEIIDYQNHLDSLIHKHIQKDGKCFASNPMIFNQRDGYSYIENRETKYGTLMQNRYKQFVQ